MKEEDERKFSEGLIRESDSIHTKWKSDALQRAEMKKLVEGTKKEN